jgi:hypothetical protein
LPALLSCGSCFWNIIVIKLPTLACLINQPEIYVAILIGSIQTPDISPCLHLQVSAACLHLQVSVQPVVLNICWQQHYQSRC